jgi:hypothetical protein
MIPQARQPCVLYRSHRKDRQSGVVWVHGTEGNGSAKERSGHHGTGVFLSGLLSVFVWVMAWFLQNK